MFQATRAIYDALSRIDGLKPFTEDNEKFSAVWLQFGLDAGGTYRIQFISTDDDNDVSIRVYGLIALSGDQRVRILPALNFLNSKYRFVKFACDKKGDVNVEYDYPVHAINPAQSAEEMIHRFVDIIDESYPVLMKALWGNSGT